MRFCPMGNETFCNHVQTIMIMVWILPKLLGLKVVAYRSGIRMLSVKGYILGSLRLGMDPARASFTVV